MAPRMGSFVACMKECVDAAKAGTLDQDAYNKLLEKHLIPTDVRRFKEVVFTAFFRQTSKLGLEFFRQRGVPILFQWSDYQCRSLLNGSGDREIHDKWWHNGYGGNTRGKQGSITYSEMRHVGRLEHMPGPKLNVIKVAGSEVG